MLSVLLTVVLLSTTFAGCGKQEASTTPTAPTKEETITIQYATWGGAAEKATEVEIIDAFMKEHKSIKVEIIHAEDSYEDKLQLMVAGGTMPDVVSIGSVHIASFASALSPLDTSDIDTSQYISDTLFTKLQYQGEQYALPKRVNTKVFAYNKDLLEQAGVEIPGTDYSIDQFTKDATAVSKIEGVYGSSALYYGQWIYQFGGSIFNEDGTVAFNSDLGKEAVQYCVDAANKYNFAPTATDTEGQDVLQWFMSKKVGFFGDCGPYYLPTLSQITDFDWDFCNAPGNGGEMEVVGVAMSNTTEHKEEAMELIKFISTAKAAQEIIGGTSACPVTEDGKVAFLAQYPDKNMQLFFDAMQTQTIQPIVKGASSVINTLYSAIYDRTKLGGGDEDVSVVLDEVAEEATALLKEAQK